MAEENINDKKTLKSEFNEAGFQILRLHNLWIDYSRYMNQGNMYSVHQTLENIWIELSADAEEVHKKVFDILNRFISRYRDAPRLPELLKIKARKLKLLQENCGKGSKKSSTYEKMI